MPINRVPTSGSEVGAWFDLSFPKKRSSLTPQSLRLALSALGIFLMALCLADEIALKEFFASRLIKSKKLK